QPGEEAADDPPQVLGEVDDRRDDRADLDDRGERGRPRPLDVHVEQLLEDGQVTGRAHRQEFGEPLDDAQDDGLPDGQHGYSPTPERSSASAAARRVRTPSSRLPTYSETASVVTPAAAYVRIPSASRSTGPSRLVRSMNSMGTAAAASRCRLARYRSWISRAASAYPIRT